MRLPRSPRLFGRRVPWGMVVGAALMLLFALAGTLGPRLMSGDPTAIHVDATLRPPSLEHPFGTDNFGRDVLLRVVHSAPVDLQMGLFMMLPGFLVGSLLGGVMGYYGGLADTLLMRLIDVLVAFPHTVVILAFIAFLGPGVATMYLAGALFSWMGYARLVRGQMLVERQLDYVSAARVLGFSDRRILLRHLLPNVMVQALVYATSGFVHGILIGSGLSFLGFGVQPPTPEWGVMISDGRLFILQAPWISGFPGLTIVAVAGAFSLFGDGLADFLRPEVEE
jgi:peptide/nickel transport system permease protein